MKHPIEIKRVSNRRELITFVRFPWKVYRNDPNWVPPLISDRLKHLSPAHNTFFSQAVVELYLARCGREPVGTIAVFIDHFRNEHLNEMMAGFGFFEVIDDYTVAQALLEKAVQQARQWGMRGIRGPTNFRENDEPGILIKSADCPPAVLEAHSPPYYQEYLERYGMQKDDDLFAWRVHLEKFEGESFLPKQLLRVFEAAIQRSDVSIRKARMKNWDSEVKIIHGLFNETLSHLPEYVPISEEDFRKFADQMRLIIDPEMAMIAEVNGEPIGFFVALPDFNRVLIHLNGRLFPIGWIKLLWYISRIDVISFKLLGVRESYRRRGVDVKMYLEALRTAARKGYKWLDGSLTSEANTTVVRLADRLGAERYKRYRLYKLIF